MQNRIIKNAVITGPTGAIGVALCNTLIQHGVEVFAVCNPLSRRKANLPKNKLIHVIDCDISRFDKLPSLISNHCDVFIHLAWVGTTGEDRNDCNIQISNIEYAISAVKSAVALGCKVFIGAGSQAECGRHNEPINEHTICNPENAYGMAKLCAGEMTRLECDKHNIVHCWARILSVYGPYDGEKSMISMTIRELLNGDSPKLTKGDQIWDYLYSEDAAEIIYRMVLSGQNDLVYTLGSGTAWPLKKYVEIIRETLKTDIPVQYGAISYSEKQVNYLVADTSLIKKDFGYIPNTSFLTGIKNTIEYMKGVYKNG